MGRKTLFLFLVLFAVCAGIHKPSLYLLALYSSYSETVVGTQHANCFITQQQGRSQVSRRRAGPSPACCHHCRVSPTGIWNHSWGKWLLLALSLACDLGKSLSLFLLHQLNRDATSPLCTSKGIYFEKQGQ